MTDTTTEAVDRLAKHIAMTCACAIGKRAEQPVAGTLRALTAERDALAAEVKRLRVGLRIVADQVTSDSIPPEVMADINADTPKEQAEWWNMGYDAAIRWAMASLEEGKDG